MKYTGSALGAHTVANPVRIETTSCPHKRGKMKPTGMIPCHSLSPRAKPSGHVSEVSGEGRSTSGDVRVRRRGSGSIHQQPLFELGSSRIAGYQFQVATNRASCHGVVPNALVVVKE